VTSACTFTAPTSSIPSASPSDKPEITPVASSSCLPLQNRRRLLASTKRSPA
jgi:hypothetical protein